MKTIQLNVEPEIAKRILAEYESGASEKIRARDELNLEITSLQDKAKTLRIQLQNANGATERTPRGANKIRVLDYLKKIPENKGAKMVEISAGTGIGVSSVNFVLQKNTDIFEKIGKLWKAKN